MEWSECSVVIGGVRVGYIIVVWVRDCDVGYGCVWYVVGGVFLILDGRIVL